MALRVRLTLTLLAALAVGLVFGAAPAARTEAFDGKVLPLADVLDKAGVKLDRDAAPHWLALVTDDGKIYPLIVDDGSRRFFKDKALLNRKMRLTGRLVPGTNFLQVLGVNSWVNGELHDTYYWCEICAIRRNEKLRQCDCCGGQLELRETPVKK